MKLRYSFIIISMLALFSCERTGTRHKSIDYQAKYSNVLNIQGIPTKAYQLEPFGFSDMGAWHGYALPHQDSTSYYGGFMGPLSMKMWGQWLGKDLSQLVLTDTKTKKIIDLSKAKASMIYQPGKLKQILELPDFSIDIQLIFVSHRSSLLYTKITNKSQEQRSLKIGWKGELFPKHLHFSEIEHGVRVNYKESNEVFVIQCSKEKDLSIAKDQLSYQMIIKEKQNIKAGEQLTFTLLHSHYFDHTEEVAELEQCQEWLNNPQSLLKENKLRWNGYLAKALQNKKRILPKEQENRLIVKCVETLLTNWRSPAGDLKYDGVFPSAAYQGFYGFWSWDSWKQAVALAQFFPELAKSNVLSMFQYQDEMGMVADCVYFNSKENNWRDTKAPLAAWAVLEIYKQTHDLDFVKQMYPKLVRYHNWWYKYRDHDENGLCEYGSTDGSLIAAKWESGMDNAVRFDSTKILKNNEHGWSMNQESVDLNAYLYAEKEELASLAKLLDKKEEAKKFTNQAHSLKDQISKGFYDTNTGYFYDRSLASKKLLTVQQGPEGWIPLYTKIANQVQAKGVTIILTDSTKFATKVPFPTLAADHRKFNPLKGYWRGPVWMDQAYFGVLALQNYGYENAAQSMTQKLLLNTEGLLQDAPIRENYHPITGKGLNAHHFSWSAAHYLLLLSDK